MRLTILLPAIVLSGCAVVATTTFDPVEYDKWIEVTHTAAVVRSLCDNSEQASIAGEALQQVVEYATLYSTTKIKSSNIAAASKTVLNLTAEFNQRYTAKSSPSKGYCVLKTTEIEMAAKAIASSIAKKEM